MVDAIAECGLCSLREAREREEVEEVEEEEEEHTERNFFEMCARVRKLRSYFLIFFFGF